MKKAKKIRTCKCCGARMGPNRLWLCESCREAGMTVKPPERINTQELDAVARARQEAGENPLEDMSLAEIAALAWDYRKEGYGSYGKLRGYVRMTGRLPERRT